MFCFFGVNSCKIVLGLNGFCIFELDCDCNEVLISIFLLKCGLL